MNAVTREDRLHIRKYTSQAGVTTVDIQQSPLRVKFSSSQNPCVRFDLHTTADEVQQVNLQYERLELRMKFPGCQCLEYLDCDMGMGLVRYCCVPIQETGRGMSRLALDCRGYSLDVGLVAGLKLPDWFQNQHTQQPVEESTPRDSTTEEMNTGLGAGKFLLRQHVQPVDESVGTPRDRTREDMVLPWKPRTLA